MDRRDFLKGTGGLIAAANLAPANATAKAQAATPGRTVFALNRGWRFSAAPSEAARGARFDDKDFARIALPHANVRLPWHGFDEKDFAFVSVYRRRFRLPPDLRGRHVFVDFEGAMTASTVFINGVRLGEYKGGFTPFFFELTPHIDWDGENVLVVELDSTERADIPPFGDRIDYLTFGGIYRQVSLRLVPFSFLENIFAVPKDVLTGHPALDVTCFVQHLAASPAPMTLDVALKQEGRVLAHATAKVEASAARAEPAPHTVTLGNLGTVALWDITHPNLYTVEVKLLAQGQVIDQDTRRTGLRQARFTERGFELNGRIVKLRGLDRHQIFPFIGQAMPARVQRRDAEILKKNLKCNIVRTSHYPQSRHFLDACDELGLLVLEEIPGWQHIGDKPWQDLSVDNVARMIRRDWNRPSIILWGVRINESKDNHDFYVRTNAAAHALDPSRQTGGIRWFQESEFLEDVFTMNDFDFPLKPPNHPLYLNTEFVGHTFPTKSIDNVERLTEHTLRHARIHDQLASDPRYAGGIGWCAFDYNTHGNFGSGDHVCYHGVMDMFREPKPAAGFYKSQCDPSEEVVLEPAFHWAIGDQSIGFSKAVVCSNCDHLKFYIGGKLVAEADPDRAQFRHLKYAPFVLELPVDIARWGDLRIEGYIGGLKRIEKNYSGAGVDQKFTLAADDTSLIADGADTTRVVFRVTDAFGAIRPFADSAVRFELEGPAEIIGDNPFALVGGLGAIWIRAREQAGTARLTAHHPRLGRQQIELKIAQAPPETV